MPVLLLEAILGFGTLIVGWMLANRQIFIFGFA